MQFKKSEIKSKNLKKREILKICNLKNEHWKYGIKSQKNWFFQNCKKNDIHYLVFFKNNLIGYLHLAVKNLLIKSKKKNMSYLEI